MVQVVRKQLKVKGRTEAFEREDKCLRLLNQLEHPNIPPIHELGVDAQKRLFFAMKMVKGRSLAVVVLF